MLAANKIMKKKRKKIYEMNFLILLIIFNRH
jgi:hypothetical protein